jgi:aminoglycoside phosphotransferase family enzyme/predicted kinase
LSSEVAHVDPPRPDLVAAMLDPGFYPHAPPSVELRETHISWVFLVGELAYKVKKPLVLPFLDYGTVERRREMCLEEVRLNQRLAPDIYRGVAAVVRDRDHYALTDEHDPDAVEYAVEMHRIEEDRTLAALAGRGELEPGQVAAVGERLRRFHAEAAVAPTDTDQVAEFVADLGENLTTLRDAGRGIVAESHLDAAASFTRACLAARRDELEARARAGMVRDCHGDLRAEHVIVPAQAPLYVFDCVEFNDSLRRIDVAADIAFLVMDLAHLGADPLARRLAEAYREAGGDLGDDALLSFFAAYRAWVRAKIACLRVHELEPGDSERVRQEVEAREFLDLGHRFAWRARGPLVLMVGGVAASGKTTLAGRLAQLSGWPHVSSDLTRKRLAGLAPAQRGREEHYTPEFTMRTYRELGRAAAEGLEQAGGVIVDATFHRRNEREAFRRGLGKGGAPLLAVECKASTDELLARVRGRESDPGRTSDADAAIVRRQLAELEPLDDIPGPALLELSTEDDPDRLALRVEEFVDRCVWRDAVEPAHT